jgi:shikimate dehydrogenase
MTDKYAVIGNPITHSKSPQIHSAFAKQTGQDILYTKLEAPIDRFSETVRNFEGRGLNVTLPFKQQAFALMNACNEQATIAQAVNTISIHEDKTLYGSNTDGIGLVRDLTVNLQFTLKDRKILILGAGGAVRGILFPLLQQHPKSVVIANRTLASAQAIVAQFQDYGDLAGVSLEDIPGPFDLIINGTSFSLQTDTVPFSPDILTKDSFCYDLMYGQEPTPFLKWAVNQGVIHVQDGLGMLVEQAAESFYIWRGVRPRTEYLIELLRKQ